MKFIYLEEKKVRRWRIFTHLLILIVVLQGAIIFNLVYQTNTENNRVDGNHLGLIKTSISNQNDSLPENFGMDDSIDEFYQLEGELKEVLKRLQISLTNITPVEIGAQLTFPIRGGTIQAGNHRCKTFGGIAIVQDVIEKMKVVDVIYNKIANTGDIDQCVDGFMVRLTTSNFREMKHKSILGYLENIILYWNNNKTNNNLSYIHHGKEKI